jgi:hypothetical protein
VLAAIGIVLLGLVVKPTESSFLLPGVDGIEQALGTAAFLAVPAAMAAALCWLATKRLHGIPS